MKFITYVLSSRMFRCDADYGIAISVRMLVVMPLSLHFGRSAVMVCARSCKCRHACESTQGMDLVIHTAGPFQWKQTCSVLEAAIAAGTPYIDVCDDADYSAVGHTLSASGFLANLRSLMYIHRSWYTCHRQRMCRHNLVCLTRSQKQLAQIL